jgi:hypothetical protein
VRDKKGQKSIKDMFQTVSSKSSAIIVSESVRPALVCFSLSYEETTVPEFLEATSFGAVVRQWSKTGGM